MRSLILTAALFLGLAPSLTAAPEDRHPAVVSVIVARGAATAMGTGTVIASEGGDSLVLTNAHVADDPAAGYTVVHGEYSYPAKYLCGSKVTRVRPDFLEIAGPDLALLVVPDKALPVARLAALPPAEGDRVRQWGFCDSTYGTRATYKTGKILPRRDYVRPITLTSIPAKQGDSGSGLFNDAGEVVAVCDSGNAEVPQFAVHLTVVREYVGAETERHKLFPGLRAALTGKLAPPPRPAAEKAPRFFLTPAGRVERGGD